MEAIIDLVRRPAPILIARALGMPANQPHRKTCDDVEEVFVENSHHMIAIANAADADRNPTETAGSFATARIVMAAMAGMVAMR
jgi:hypothetical protein